MRRRRVLRFLTIALLAGLSPIIALAGLSALASKPTNLGVNDGRLAECPNTPNCVCSQSQDEAHFIDPIRFDGGSDEAMTRLKRAVTETPRLRIVSEAPNYLHVEATSRWFRFVDDMEFLVDPASQVIHVRSASRIGSSDLGANRRRIEALRNALKDRPSAEW